MARLNDFTAPAESIEALKRRFVRQNREIARVNSMQSLRIRSLESEVSHLLAENVSLREQVINLTHDIDRLQAAKSLSDGVYEIKSRLDAKLAELSGLSSDLGLLPRKVGKLESEQHGTELDRPKATASEARPRATDSEGHAEFDDGRLPAILEDKYYPRRTLEAREIQNLVEADTSILESPNVVRESTDSRFDVDLESPTPKVTEDRPENRADDATSPDPFFPPTLETRKKKKKPAELTSQVSGNETWEVSGPSNETAQPTQSGSKRKFIPDDDGFMTGPAPEDDEFQFSRSSHSPRKKAEPQEPSPSKTPIAVEAKTVKPASVKRKVLEPKSANTNLGSPKKAHSLHPDSKLPPRIGGNENNLSPQKPKELLNQKPKRPSLATRGARQSSDSLKAKRSSRSIGMDESTQDHPNPSSMVESPIAQPDESASRPSRRRGAVVSYAEPNLRAKMRRPTKEFIDAVANQESRRSSSFQLIQEGLSDDSDHHGSRPHSGGLPADLALADQSSDMFSRNESGQRLSSVSQRKRKVSSANKANDQSSTGLDDDNTSAFASEASSLADLQANSSKQVSRRQPRRHSSNPKGMARKTSPERAELSLDTASFLQSSLEDDDDAGWKDSTSDVGVRRETRITARRKSMMV